MATREQSKANSTVVQNMQWFPKKSLTKPEALTFIHHEGPSWPPKSMALGCPNYE